jgi:hypothetical protein
MVRSLDKVLTLILTV